MRDVAHRAEAVRDFNRFYTSRIGALGDAHLGSAFSLTEVRVLYELAHREHPTASEIGEALDLDAGYLSRTLRAFRKRGLISATPGEDRRRAHLSLTAAGKKAFAPLDRQARDAIVRLLQPLSEAGQTRILSAMQTIREALEAPHSLPDSRYARRASPFALRPHRSGDMGWVVYRHGVLYRDEYGYDERFEAIVARVVADFIDHLDPARERCWIAERDGEFAGCVFVVAKSRTVAKLRLLLVEPSARGCGLGRRLVDEVIAFAREAGYKKIQLWTQSELTAARTIYKATGFKLVAKQGHEMFSKHAVAETWELELGD